MPERIPQSVAVRVPLKVFLASDHVSPATGKTVAVVISKNGAAFANPSGGATNATEIANGWYYVDLSTTDTGTAGPLVVRGTSGSCDDAEIVYTVANAHNAGFDGVPNAAAGANAGLPVLSVGATMLAYTVSTLTTYTGNTPQTGDAYARLGVPAGASVSADVAAVKAKTDNLPASPAAASDCITAAGVRSAVGLASASLDTQLAGNLAAIQNVQNNTFVATSIPQFLERPDSGSVTVNVSIVFSDETGSAKNLDSGNPAIALVNDAGTDLSARLGTTTNPATGKYVVPYTSSASDAIEGLHWDVTGTVNSKARRMVAYTQVVDTTAIDFTSADRTKLNQLATDYTTARAGKIDNLDAAVATRMASYAQPAGFLAATFPAVVGDATAANQATLLSRLGAFAGSGVNTVLGLLKATLSKSAATPSDVGGTFDPATDSAEAIQEQGAGFSGRLPAALDGSGNMKSSALALSGDAPAAQNLAASVRTTTVLTVGAGSTTTSIVAASVAPALTDDDQFKGLVLKFRGDTATAGLRGQGSSVTACDQATQTITVTALTRAPAAGDVAVIN